VAAQGGRMTGIRDLDIHLFARRLFARRIFMFISAEINHYKS
jgi:hypothetical protein